jgi:hypothetical protein
MCDGNFLEFVNLFLVFFFWGGGGKGIYSTKYYFMKTFFQMMKVCHGNFLLLKVLIIITRAFDVLIASHNHFMHIFIKVHIYYFF